MTLGGFLPTKSALGQLSEIKPGFEKLAGVARSEPVKKKDTTNTVEKCEKDLLCPEDLPSKVEKVPKKCVPNKIRYSQSRIRYDTRIRLHAPTTV